MDFDFTEQQVMLRDASREYLEGECNTAFVRSMMEDPLGYSPQMWQQIAEMGLLGVVVPEQYGGLGLGGVELALVLEEMGRAVFPGPYFPTAALATRAIMEGGREDQRERYLPSIAAGKTRATLAMLEQGLDWGAGAVKTEAEREGSGYVLRGRKRFVPFAHCADLLLVPARTEPRGDDPRLGITIFAIDAGTPGVTQTPMHTVDLTNRAAQVDLEDVRVEADQALGEVNAGWPVLEDVLRWTAVAATAEMLGCSRKSLEMSVDYVKVRQQFGQPVGAFQAVKHQCADMLLEVEQSHAATYYAAWALAANSPDAAMAASVAKAYVSEAARKVCGNAIQVHGGIGFTWEYDLHLYFKRAKYLETLYGDADFHREQVLRLTLGG